MADVRNILKKASGYSDSGITKDLPPTYQDTLMRIAHTSDSVEYNLDHAEDHLAELCSQLGKLSGVDRNKASLLAHKVCNYLDKVYGEVQVFKLDNDGKVWTGAKK